MASSAAGTVLLAEMRKMLIERWRRHHYKGREDFGLCQEREAATSRSPSYGCG